MNNDTAQIQSALAEPFPYADIEWRIQQSGIQKDGETPWAMVLAYVTNRAIMQRLDDVMGIGGWRNEYKDAPEGGVLCGISLHINGDWITKWDGAGQTAVEATKGGLSGAMKRAAVQWGVGRYLYGLEASFAKCHADNSGVNRAVFKNEKTGNKIYGTWDSPNMPTWALPNGLAERFFDLISAGDAYNYFLLTKELGEETLIELFNKFPRGEKTSRKTECRELEKSGAAQFNETIDHIRLMTEKEDGVGVVEIWEETTDQEKRLMWPQLESEHDFIKAEIEASK